MPLIITYSQPKQIKNYSSNFITAPSTKCNTIINTQTDGQMHTHPLGNTNDCFIFILFFKQILYLGMLLEDIEDDNQLKNLFLGEEHSFVNL